MDNEQSSADAQGVSRGQNQLLFNPEDWHSGAALFEPAIARIDANENAVQIVIITGDADAATGLAEHLAPDAYQRNTRILAATDARRSARAMKVAPPHLVIGPASTLVELAQTSALKFDAVKVVGLAWAERGSGAEARALESIMAEMPKDSARIVVASAPSAEVDQLVERYARRARKPAAIETETHATVPVSYVTSSERGRIDALRRLLDAIDPESAYVFARTPHSREAVARFLLTLGYGFGAQPVRSGDAPDPAAREVILYDFPGGPDEVRRLAGARIIAIVTPRQVASLRRVAGGTVTPFTLPEAAARARSREQALRDELRAELDGGEYARELLALEPLLSDFDGTEIAAAALRLLEKSRAKARESGGGTAPPSMTRLFVNVGELEGVKAGDLVGAITKQAGIARDELGKVEVRERHSTVEVATSVANTVVSRMTGVTIRGRRAVVKVDDGPSERPRRDRPPRGDRPERRERPQRPERPRPRGR